MTEREDERLEQAVRGALRRRDPGQAPIGLRERAARVPESGSTASGGRRALARAGIPLLGLAAAILLLVIAAPLVAPRGSGPGASAAPGTTFDPSLRGPGLVPPPAVEAEGLVVLGLIVAGLVVLIVAPRGPRRALATLAIVAVLAFGGAQILLTHAVTGPVASSGGIGVLNSDAPAPDSRETVIIDAAPGDPFSFGFSVMNEGPLPIRLEGVVADPLVEEGAVYYPTLRAIWSGGPVDPHVLSGPQAPFSPVDLGPGSDVMLWLVGTASPCAAGPSYDPATATDTALVGMPVLRVEYSVLGLPRTAEISLPFDLMQPYQSGCPSS